MSRWDAVSSDDYYEEVNTPRQPQTVPCADCGTPVDLDETDLYRVAADIRCLCCGGKGQRHAE